MNIPCRKSWEQDLFTETTVTKYKIYNLLRFDTIIYEIVILALIFSRDTFASMLHDLDASINTSKQVIGHEDHKINHAASREPIS